MAKYAHSKDKEIYELVVKELEHFKKLMKGHEKLIKAIGEL